MANKAHLVRLKEFSTNKNYSRWREWRANYPIIDLSEANLCNTYLAGLNLDNTDFHEADLSGANLSDCDLDNVDLRHANLMGASLNCANIRCANLTCANLEGVDLNQADLRVSDLTNANLSNAILYGTHMANAILNGTRFDNAHISMMFDDIDLSNAQGLDTVKHNFQSYITINTILKSKGQIPELFMQHMMIAASNMDYVKALTGTSPQFSPCFISYSHKDKTFAQMLHDKLLLRGIRCWLDEKEILPGAKISNAIADGIKYSERILLCCSKDSLNSWWVNSEIDIAFAKEKRLWSAMGQEIYILIPLNLDGFMFSNSWNNGNAEQIRSRLAADFAGWEANPSKFQEQLGRVVMALKSSK